MRVLYLGNNRLGVEVLKFLKEEDEEIVGIGVHPPHKRTYGQELLDVAGLQQDRILPGQSISQPETANKLRQLNPDLVVSVLFGYILSPEVLKIPRLGSINLHPAYLPYNRGANPNVWSIVEGAPAGVTLHYMGERIDTGDIIARESVSIEPTDTGKTLYRKIEQTGLELFRKTWSKIREGRASRLPQNGNEGTYHRVSDLDQIDRIDLEATYRARNLINILRARTFRPHKGAYFEIDGRRVYMRLDLQYEEDFD